MKKPRFTNMSLVLSWVTSERQTYNIKTSKVNPHLHLQAWRILVGRFCYYCFCFLFIDRSKESVETAWALLLHPTTLWAPVLNPESSQRNEQELVAGSDRQQSRFSKAISRLNYFCRMLWWLTLFTRKSSNIGLISLSHPIKPPSPPQSGTMFGLMEFVRLISGIIRLI